MKNWLRHRVTRHMLFWVAVMGFFLLMQLPAHLLAGAEVHVLVMFTNQLPLSLLATYSLLYGLLPLLLVRRRVALFLSGLGVWLFVCWLLTALLRVFGFLAMSGHAGAPKQALQWTDYLTLPYTFFTVLVTAGVACAIKVSNEWYKQRQISQQLLQRKLQTELQLLKAQLQPTFLFDTLRMLHTLTSQKSASSPAAVLHLSALLRYLLYDSQQAMVPLASEVEMIQHYVALEQLRLGNQWRYR
ncbi:histidine kinase [Hymenobacter sp. GOD-10R]|uniref:histidine kinase n=1 Tax=Hymenobacter sp. GOD-10R TaxID=3093922 RepID=UPI002D768898|nr:histidine kinase [Hymenobacter sp. GOD-10R]WRQ27709.1 histidine kinase [Hymenobacter sp. GOD-10R]